MEYDASGLVSRRHRGAGFAEVVSAQQRDLADLDQDGSTTDYVPLAPLYDGAYDCVGVLDHTGGLAESYVHAYDGAVTITNAAGTPIGASAVGWQQGYGRLYRDSETGLLYATRRYHNTASGRFLNRDPGGSWFDRPGLGNGYAWLANRFRNNTDPLGLGPAVSRRAGVSGEAERNASALATTLDSALDAVAATEVDLDLVDADAAMDENAEIVIMAVADGELNATQASDGERTLGRWRYAADTRGRGRHWIRISESVLNGTAVAAMWTLIHELLHAVHARCGRPQHGRDVDSGVMFEQRVYDIFLTLTRDSRFGLLFPADYINAYVIDQMESDPVMAGIRLRGG
jgi:RHS repeat-associated protein